MATSGDDGGHRRDNQTTRLDPPHLRSIPATPSPSPPVLDNNHQAHDLVSQLVAHTNMGPDSCDVEAELSSSATSSDLEALRAAADEVKYEEQVIFKPFQELFKTPIRLEYGTGSNDAYTVHLELLNCSSTKFHALFQSTEPLKQSFQKIMSTKRELEILIGETDAESFDKSCRSRAFVLMLPILFKFPLEDHHKDLEHAVDETVDKLFTDKENHLCPPSTGGLKKKLYKEDTVTQRVRRLSNVGVRALSQKMIGFLDDIRLQESALAYKDPVKAAAQGRIILPNADENTLSRITRWVYNKELFCQDARDLCQIRAVAEELGLIDLAETCLSRLSSSASAEIERAHLEGKDLCSMFSSNTDLKPGAPFSFLWSVFRHVMESDNPPELLQELVVNSLALERDGRLFKFMAKRLNGTMKDRIINALYEKNNAPFG